MIHLTKEYEDIGVSAPVWQNIRALVENATMEAHLSGVKIINDIASGTRCSPTRSSSRYYNLTQNAVRHGGRVLSIRFSIETKDGVHAIVCHDNGAGIGPRTKDMLFTEGFGSEHGLGLFLSKEILATTGIDIKEEGEPGKGAKFVMTIPSDGFRINPMNAS
ncbi:MAG TPA: HAMP domain-containing sensor histidine kinase [Methanomassiliicoccales archaeon]|nr:HAMP domain-containing sensor histidine kinase [Methanomassiliicoccales archaeon]